MKPHYFRQIVADRDDLDLAAAKLQGYVPMTCLLGGDIVTSEVAAGRKPCWGCDGPRARCQGEEKREGSPPITFPPGPSKTGTVRAGRPRARRH